MELGERILPCLEVLDCFDGTLDQDCGSRDRDEASQQDHQQGPGGEHYLVPEMGEPQNHGFQY